MLQLLEPKVSPAPYLARKGQYEREGGGRSGGEVYSLGEGSFVGLGTGDGCTGEED